MNSNDKQHPYRKIKNMVLVFMSLTPLLPVSLILGTGYYYFKTSIETNAFSTLKRIMEDHRLMLDSFLLERKSDLEFILYSYKYDEIIQPDKITQLFENLRKKSSAFVDIGIFDDKGTHIAYRGPYELKGKVYVDTDWFKNTLKEGYYISDIFLGFRQVPHFVIALLRDEGHIKWVIRATIDTYKFNSLVEKVRFGKTGEAYVLNSEGILQTNRRSGGNLMEKHKDPIDIPEAKDGYTIFIKEDIRKIEYLYATTWLHNNKWLLVIRVEKEDAFKSLQTATHQIILISILGGIIVISTAFYLTSIILERMSKIDTEKESLNLQLIRAARLAELGEMAAGFAHEINNPLQIIRTEQAMIDVLLSEMKEKGELVTSERFESLVDSLNQIKVQIKRCAGITQSILNFGRQTEPVIQEIDLRSFIPEVSHMIEKKANVHGIQIIHDISEDIPRIKGDPGQLQQVLLNLYNNAIDAIVERHQTRGGIIRIHATYKENKVILRVTDNGIGIDSENLKNIFSPFFTTKPVGKGTGLGLSVCYGIIEKMNGTMEVTSEKYMGTTFSIYLPAVYP